MAEQGLKAQIQEDMKDAMRKQDKARLSTIRLILAAIKQKEVDERIELQDIDVLRILDKMIKQRRDSINQFGQAGRQDLVDKESAELVVINQYLPEPLTDEQLTQIVAEAVEALAATSVKDMAKVMGHIKAKIEGRADMKVVGEKVKQALQH